MTAWLDELAALDGDELYELIGKLSDARVIAATYTESLGGGDVISQQRASFGIELYELFLDALKQVARITVPYKEAQGVIWRAIYARNHPVRVPGTR